jgi:Ala-tRNA(Pro) deacylase
MSKTLHEYLEDHARPYELLHHARTSTAMATAAAAHVSADQLAKCVLVEDERNYMLAVVPATHRLRLAALRERFGHVYGLATEWEVEWLFSDCETGALPALGQAYGIDVLVDEELLKQDDIYFAAGDRAELVHVAGEDFRALMVGAERGCFSR